MLLFLWLNAQEAPLTTQEIFDRSAAAHLGEKKSLQIEDFRLEFNLEFRAQQHEVELLLTHYFLQPDLVKTIIEDQEIRTTMLAGFDGKKYWFKKQGDAAVDLSGKEYVKDRAEIDERIRLSQILVKTFSLHRFFQDLRNAKRLQDTQTSRGKRVVVQAQGKDFPLLKTAGIPPVDLHLFFDPETWYLREIYATPLRNEKGEKGEVLDSSRAELFVLSEHEKIQEILVPRMIQVFTKTATETKPDYQILIGSLKINQKLKPENFSGE